MMELYGWQDNELSLFSTNIDEDMDNTFMFLKSNLYMGGGDNKYYF